MLRGSGVKELVHCVIMSDVVEISCCANISDQVISDPVLKI
jgi:hypothetical protein